MKEFFTSRPYSQPMRVSDRLERLGGYVATGPGLATVTALSLSSLRKRIEAQLPPTEAIKQLDRVARRERDRRPGITSTTVALSPGTINATSRTVSPSANSAAVWCGPTKQCRSQWPTD
jgi:hypothetical protein